MAPNGISLTVGLRGESTCSAVIPRGAQGDHGTLIPRNRAEGACNGAPSDYLPALDVLENAWMQVASSVFTSKRVSSLVVFISSSTCAFGFSSFTSPPWLRAEVIALTSWPAPELST